ncbi:DUF1800 domain-containing protein [Actinomycetospora endophytica]|uniref:DUF1800 domain-containing protein n=1 Tax=Actinomycetospora endophytica TaxID=2291215 RepID=A0ABS8PD90_9PSEU|nr:DUF1800 domain-containing protein [Actinomycetospora endophytica]MCD2196244.1 DUF1800 domain-containing protein [Actinomycetospora endophytica]
MPAAPPLDERAAVRRLLDRLGTGARRPDVDAGATAGFDATLDALLTRDEPLPTDLPSFPPLPAVKADDPRKDAVEAARRDQEQASVTWWLDRMATVAAPRAEKLTWFWHGHFATSNQKVRDPQNMIVQNQTFRTLGQDSFETLAHAMVVDPALTLWLDNQTNRKGIPNENLGRELMELFTLGVGHYAETDVREAARALTGWTYEDRAVTFAPTKFDDAPKTVLGTTADYDAEGLVSMLAARPESARFVASRLWFRLVSATPPSEADLDALVAAYGSGTAVRPLLRAIATTPAFRDPTTALVKQPVEWAVGLSRALGRPLGALPAADQSKALNQLKGLGQVPFDPPNVGGWPAGAPYLTASATVVRLGFAQTLLKAAPLSGPVEPPPSGSNARVEWARATLAVDGWSGRTRTALQSLAGGDPRQLLAAAAVSPEYVVSV